MPTVLITGASRGIGWACTEAFAAAGYDIVGVARTQVRGEVLEEWRARFPNRGLQFIEADLAGRGGPHDVPRGAYDVVVLNAAQYAPGSLLGGSGDVYGQLFGLNVLANHRLARRLLPPLTARGSGHLVVVGSTGTDHFKGHMTAYVATKYALRGLFLGWERELAGTGVGCTLVAPGATRTSSWAGEEVPADILEPEVVAGEVLRAVREKLGGRLLVTNEGERP